jgi:hypothetical protein
MDYVKISPEALDLLKEMTDLAEKLMGILHKRISENAKLAENFEINPIVSFLFFFLQRAVNIGRTTVSLIENKQYQDAWVIGRVAFEGRYYVLLFDLDRSIAKKWVSFYTLQKYRQEYDLQGEAAAEEFLMTISPESVVGAEAEFGESYKDPNVRLPKWHKRGSVAEIVKELEKAGKIGEKDHSLFYATYSEVVHWAPLGIIEAAAYIGAIIGTTFTFILQMSITVNSEFVMGLESDIADIKRRYVECARRATPT